MQRSIRGFICKFKSVCNIKEHVFVSSAIELQNTYSIMLTFLALVTSLLFPSVSDWAWSLHPERGFKILTPVALAHKVIEMPVTGGSVQYHQYNGGSLNDTLNQLAFTIDSYRLEDDELRKEDAYLKEFFTTTVDEMLSAIDGDLIYFEQLSQAGRNICIWKASFNRETGVARGKIILTARDYYGLQAFGLKANDPDASMVRFFDSFQLMK